MRFIEARHEAAAPERLGTPRAPARQQRGAVEGVDAEAVRRPLPAKAGAPRRAVDLEVRLERVEVVAGAGPEEVVTA